MIDKHPSHDRLVLVCTALCVLCAVVTVLVVAPTVLDASNRATQNEEAIERANRAAAAARKVAEDLDRVGVERRDDSCRKDEREHLEAVEALKRTYAYLASLTPRQRREPINAAVLRFLPDTERRARNDVAPEFCDEPGVRAEELWYRTRGEQGAPPVGLREPDPEIPERPRVLR